MCFNKESSFFTWIVAFTIGIYLLQKGSYWKAYFLLTFSFIQLLEAIIWYSLENNNHNLNSNTTKAVLIALWLQPIVNCFCAMQVVPYFKYLLIMSVLMLLYSFYRTLCTNEQFKSLIGPTRHLIWTSNQSDSFLAPSPFNAIYTIGLCLPIFVMPNNTGPLFVLFTTILWSYYNYWKTREFSSMWCFSAASFAIVYSLFD